MATEGTNISGEFARIRDYFLNAEKDYLAELIKDKNNLREIMKYQNMSTNKVLSQIKLIIDVMEQGAFVDGNGEFVVIGDELSQRLEKKLVLLFASVDDAIRIHIKELYPEDGGYSL